MNFSLHSNQDWIDSFKENTIKPRVSLLKTFVFDKINVVIYSEMNKL